MKCGETATRQQGFSKNRGCNVEGYKVTYIGTGKEEFFTSDRVAEIHFGKHGWEIIKSGSSPHVRVEKILPVEMLDEFTEDMDARR